jgi:hypothetical protein
MSFKKLLLIMVAILLVVSTYAQDKKPGTITGVVKEAGSKLPLFEAVVTLSSDAFKGQRFALTDSAGNYRVSNLPAGNYSVYFEMEGYEKFVKNDVIVEQGMSVNVSSEMVKERKMTRSPK